MKKNHYEIIRYKTAKSCLASFHHCKESEVNSKGWWIFTDTDGKQKRISKKNAYKRVMKCGCWGFAEQKKKIHIWIAKRAKLSDAISLLAHEIGHCQKPFHRTGEEEIKAGRYEMVAELAFRILVENFCVVSKK